MKTLYLLIIASVFFFTGCNEIRPTQRLSVCIFEPTETDKIATEADLELLEAYANSSQVNKQVPERIGYNLRLSANQDLNSSNQTIFNQGLPSHPKTVQDVAIGKLTFSPDGDYELSIYVGGKDPADMDAASTKSNLSANNSGTMKLSNGWIASWSVESEVN
ncbi:MAG: hypothetical protein ACSHYA_04995 [Opitutaceae bacterium]